MKTYDQRMEAILKKAKKRKIVLACLKTVTSALCIVAVVFGLTQLPLGNEANQLDVPFDTAPPATEPQEPMSTTLLSTVPSVPDITVGPHDPNETPNWSPGFEAISVRTTQPSTVDRYPAAHLIRSVEELDAFFAQRQQVLSGFAVFSKPIASLDDRNFFEENTLIVLMLEANSGSVLYNVTDVAIYANNEVFIEIESTVPEIGTCDMAYWCILVEVGGLLPEKARINYQINSKFQNVVQADKPIDKIPDREQKQMKLAFLKQFVKDGEQYTADDVSLDVVAVFDNRYVLFVDGIFGYDDCVEEETVNGFTFIYGSSQKMYLYFGGYYYRLQEAYDANLITDDELQQLYDAYRSEYSFHYDTENISDYLIEEDGKQYLILPISKEKVRVSNSYTQYLDDIDLDLLKAAEKKIREELSQYSDTQVDFYLQDREGYLYLTAEIIVDITPPSGAEDSGCGIDHEHKFFEERITK